MVCSKVSQRISSVEREQCVTFGKIVNGAHNFQAKGVVQCNSVGYSKVLTATPVINHIIYAVAFFSSSPTAGQTITSLDT